MSNEMPPNISIIRDAVIDHALRGSPLPENIEELYEWLMVNKIYGSALDEMTYDFYFHLTQIEFSDEELRSAEELDGSVAIDDKMRIAYGRQAIEDYVNGYNDHLLSPESIKLENDRGDTTYACGMGYMAGQAGIEMTWDGFYESREKYLETLRTEHCMRDSIDIDQITDEEILAQWKYD